MKKLFLLLAVIGTSSFASSLNMHNLQCRTMKLNASTTLKDVQNNCLIKEQKMSKSGLYQVQFRNDATQKTVTCNFPSKDATAPLNGCK